jgi:hypothetical protein
VRNVNWGFILLWSLNLALDAAVVVAILRRWPNAPFYIGVWGYIGFCLICPILSILTQANERPNNGHTRVELREELWYPTLHEEAHR